MLLLKAKGCSVFGGVGVRTFCDGSRKEERTRQEAHTCTDEGEEEEEEESS
jgi:hypothetical protein